MFQKIVKTLANNSQLNGLLSLLEKCKNLKQFKEFHAHLIKFHLLAGNPFPICRLLSATAISGDATLFAYACSIFHSITNRNTFMYNTMIRGYVQTENPIPAISCYVDMLECRLPANNYTFPPLIKACTLLLPSSLHLGHFVHAHVVKFGFSDDGFVRSALVEFYSSNLDMGTARKIFDGFWKRDVVLWTSMIDGYAKSGDMDSARYLFEEMPDRNVITWSVMIAGYNRVSNFGEALTLFEQMQEMGMRPNESVLASVLTACAHIGALTQGFWVHSYTKLHGLDSNPILGTALTDMYAKCGCVDSAMSVFEDITVKDTGAWNAIISGVAMNGNAKRSLELFYRMCVNGTKPNEVTFVAVLSACAHAGLVDEGIELFHQMSEAYGVKPHLEHQACVVDLLARAGHLEEAERFVEEKMGGFAGGDANVWGAILSACRVYRNVEVGNRVWGKLERLKLGDCGIYVLLYNIYREAGWEMEANRVRSLITEEGQKKKKPGCSLIEVDGGVEEFLASDLSHPQASQMLEMLDSLNNGVKWEGLCL
ncbi:hypothetical protein AAC387_Pa03g3449 [Persea americana]